MRRRRQEEPKPMTDDLLFSYGALRDPAVQLLTFGRRLEGVSDVLGGYRVEEVAVTEPALIAAHGGTRQSVLCPGQGSERVSGMAYKVGARDLELADAYAGAAYVRVRATLVSGQETWVFVST
ncbi:MAG: gamma-glutamylcyclotransferase [Brevundimonas sp.]|nr:MAG: gamma-glutamylcyclotransferase [Brevundimonas sp.]